MAVLFRAITYSTLFIGFVLVFLPAQFLAGGGVAPPAGRSAPQVAGMLVAAAGAALAVWCILTFALVGRGTPAPFDPPRHLVAQGPTGTSATRCISALALRSRGRRCFARRPSCGRTRSGSYSDRALAA
jgi:hypothetical protein